jgi:hypothetical protein
VFILLGYKRSGIRAILSNTGNPQCSAVALVLRSRSAQNIHDCSGTSNRWAEARQPAILARMRVRKPLLLVFIASAAGGCGARTGDLDSDSTWGTPDGSGGTGTGLAQTVGGANQTGGTTWRATGGTTWRATGGTTWRATGGTTWRATSTVSSCPAGTPGCLCYASGLCASPYTCYSGYCTLISGSGGVPPYGGSTPVSFGGFPAAGGSRNTSLGGQTGMGGRSQSTGGVSPIVACGQSLQACTTDSGCNSMLECIVKFASVCNNSLDCYLLQCSASITGSSALLAIQLYQDCSSLLVP